MSRLIQPPIEDGDNIDAAGLNNRFTQFNQAGTIDEFNVRDAAFDLPQFEMGNSAWLSKDMAVKEMGWNLWKHTSDWTFAGQTTGLLPYRVKDAAGADDVLSFGPLGFTLNTGDLLRIYWDLSVRPRWEGTRPWVGAALTYTFPGVLGNVEIFSGYGCWAFWLQWDITSNALANFVNVPNQGDFNTPVVATRGGEYLSNCESTSVIQSVVEYATSFQNGTALGALSDTPMGWTTADGSWHYPRSAPSALTVYGARVVFSGPFGAYHGPTRNYLVRNDSVADDAFLDHQAGSIQALVMRKG